MASNKKSNPSFHVSLLKSSTEKGSPFDVYHLKVTDTSGQWPEKKILVANLQRSGGGFRLEKWELNWDGERPIISAYLEASIMGHDLDQWAHYDWETGERLMDYVPKKKRRKN